MKKTFLAIIAILSAIPFISQAQWTSGGSGNYYINSGYASIGTMNFLHPLTISNGSSGTFSQTQIGLYNPYTSNADVRNWMIATDENSYGSLAFKTSTSQGGNPSSAGIVRLLIDKVGNVGIGTTSPVYKLDVQGGNAAIYNAGSQSALNIGSTATGKTYLEVKTSADANGYSSLQSISTSGSAFGNISLNPFGGKVGIGTTVPDQLLTVKGTIHSQEVKVDLSVPGPDYVFHPTYKLPSLTEVKAFIDKNQHLSEIPSAAEMAKNGLDLGDMNVKLLKKVEELTLYLIQQKEETENRDKAQQYQIDELKKQIETLTKRKP